MCSVRKVPYAMLVAITAILATAVIQPIAATAEPSLEQKSVTDTVYGTVTQSVYGPTSNQIAKPVNAGSARDPRAIQYEVEGFPQIVVSNKGLFELGIRAKVSVTDAVYSHPISVKVNSLSLTSAQVADPTARLTSQMEVSLLISNWSYYVEQSEDDEIVVHFKLQICPKATVTKLYGSGSKYSIGQEIGLYAANYAFHMDAEIIEL